MNGLQEFARYSRHPGQALAAVTTAGCIAQRLRPSHLVALADIEHTRSTQARLSCNLLIRSSRLAHSNDLYAPLVPRFAR